MSVNSEKYKLAEQRVTTSLANMQDCIKSIRKNIKNETLHPEAAIESLAHHMAGTVGAMTYLARLQGQAET